MILLPRKNLNQSQHAYLMCDCTYKLAISGVHGTIGELGADISVGVCGRPRSPRQHPLQYTLNITGRKYTVAKLFASLYLSPFVSLKLFERRVHLVVSIPPCMISSRCHSAIQMAAD